MCIQTQCCLHPTLFFCAIKEHKKSDELLFAIGIQKTLKQNIY